MLSKQHLIYTVSGGDLEQVSLCRKYIFCKHSKDHIIDYVCFLQSRKLTDTSDCAVSTVEKQPLLSRTECGQCLWKLRCRGPITALKTEKHPKNADCSHLIGRGNKHSLFNPKKDSYIKTYKWVVLYMDEIYAKKVVKKVSAFIELFWNPESYSFLSHPRTSCGSQHFTPT